MDIIRGSYNFKTSYRNCVATIGNFDGVHKGHQAVFRGLIKHAKRLNLPACVITFEPLPDEYFSQKKVTTRLSRLREKAQLIADLGIDRLLILRFNEALANQTAEDFIDQILQKGLGVQYLIVGDDFRFGKNRAGNYALLQKAGAQSGFDIESTQTYLMGDERVSSTRIRTLLDRGDLQAAAELLGRSYSISGRVMYGNQLGRTIGFPTANIALKRRKIPLLGVFAVEIVDEQGDTYQGMANIGTRPTIGGSQQLLEVHLFDFEENIYGQHLTIVFQKKIREEKKFAGVAELTRALEQDKRESQAFFAKNI